MKPTEHNLDWLAFRYVSGELTGDETESFELRLADDQAARDAVASAVELSQAIVAAESLASPVISPAAALRKSWSTHIAWFACGAAACLLVVLALNFAGQQRESSVSPVLANRWSEQLNLAIEDEETPEVPREGDESDETFAASDWMVEAVRSLHENQPDEGDSDSSNEMET